MRSSIKIFSVFLITILSIHRVQGQGLDLRILESINGPASPADHTWKGVSSSAYFTITAVPVGMLITGLATHNHELTDNALSTAGSIIVAEGFTAVLKQVTHRERPYLAHPGLIYGKSNPTDYSFPSGHASTVFALATSLSLSFPKWYVIAPSFAYASAVGYSRMYLGVHYPSDVLAGALVGAGSSLLTFKLQRLLDKRYAHHEIK